MSITDAITITELSRLLQKSRPTIYKYLTDFESGQTTGIPNAVLELFRKIEADELSRDEIVLYCQRRFGTAEAEMDPAVGAAIDYIKENHQRIDYDKLEKYLRKATR